MRDPRRAYRVVDDFEAELADYTGAPFAVAVDSCTNALLLALTWDRLEHGYDRIGLPRRTYIGVLQAALNAGYEVEWDDTKNWQTAPDPWYALRGGSYVVDSARYFAHGMFLEGPVMMCLSFHAAKQLPLGRGGAILTDDEQAAEWLRAARMDGRPPGAPIQDTQFPGYHCPMPPDTAARGLDILSRWNDAGYSPPPLPATDYPDLSAIYPTNDTTSAQETCFVCGRPATRTRSSFVGQRYTIELCDDCDPNRPVPA